MQTHRLKTIPCYFERCWNLQKTFEVRKNDRDSQTRDKVVLEEYNPKTETYSGREIEGTIKYVLSDYPAIQSGYVVFSFEVNNCLSCPKN